MKKGGDRRTRPEFCMLPNAYFLFSQHRLKHRLLSPWLCALSIVVKWMIRRTYSDVRPSTADNTRAGMPRYKRATPAASLALTSRHQKMLDTWDNNSEDGMGPIALFDPGILNSPSTSSFEVVARFTPSYSAISTFNLLLSKQRQTISWSSSSSCAATWVACVVKSSCISKFDCIVFCISVFAVVASAIYDYSNALIATWPSQGIRPKINIIHSMANASAKRIGASCSTSLI